MKIKNFIIICQTRSDSTPVLKDFQILLDECTSYFKKLVCESEVYKSKLDF